MNRNTSVPDKAYSLFQIGSASTDQSRRARQPLCHRSGIKALRAQPWFHLHWYQICALPAAEIWSGSDKIISVILEEKKNMLLTSAPFYLQKIVNSLSTVKGEWYEIISALEESTGTKSSLLKEKHYIWVGRMGLLQFCACTTCLWCSWSDLILWSEALHHSFSVMCVQHFMRLPYSSLTALAMRHYQ